MPSRKHKNTFNLPNKKPRHKNRRSSAPCVKEDEEHCTSGCHPMPIMYSFFERLIKIPLNIPLKITWWIYGTLKYLLPWPLHFCCDKTTVTEHLTQSTPKSDDDSLLGNPQEQEMLQLKNDIIYNRETYQQEKRIQENEIKDYQYQLSEASSKIGALEMSRNDVLSRYQQEKRILENEIKDYQCQLSEASSKIGTLEMSSSDALSRYQQEKRILENEIKDYQCQLSEASSKIGTLEMSSSDALSRYQQEKIILENEIKDYQCQLSEASTKIGALEMSRNDVLSRYQQEKRILENEIKDYQCQLSEASSKIGTLEMSSSDALSRYQQEKIILENEIKDYQCQLSEASSKIGTLEISSSDALSRYQQEKRIQEKEIKDYQYQISEDMSKIDALEISRNDALSRYQQEKRIQEKEIKDYQYQISEDMSKIDALEISRNDALSRLERANREINDLKKTKDDALSRLSAMMGAKLRDKNPAITDLNDPNRPMKIGEQYSGVYENEWTDAFIDLEDMKSDVNDGACIDEEEAIAILLNILRELNEKSILESDHQLSILLQSVQGHSQDMSSEVTKSTKDTHKANAAKYIPVLYKKITCEDSHCKTVLKYTSHCQSYIEKCLKVCYFAAVQDPPMYLDFEPGEDTFDRQVYKEYTQMGTKVKFLVWPALFLHKGGALISKGVLQPILDTN